MLKKVQFQFQFHIHVHIEVRCKNLKSRLVYLSIVKSKYPITITLVIHVHEKRIKNNPGPKQHNDIAKRAVKRTSKQQVSI